VPKAKSAASPNVKETAKPKTGKRVAIAEPDNTASTATDDNAQEEDGPNMALNSFESVMAAMDEELARHKGATEPKPKPKPKSNPKTATKSTPTTAGIPTGTGKAQPLKPLPKLPTEADLEDLDDDELEAMDRELKAALKSAGYNSEDDDDDFDIGAMDIEEAKDLQGDDRREYRMMRDLLESYKSQGGESGVVGNLFGRLGEGK
jgi:hypothetical protein